MQFLRGIMERIGLTHKLDDPGYISKKVDDTLKISGWYPGRKVDIVKYEEFLLKQGYEKHNEYVSEGFFLKQEFEINDLIRNFLQEFAGLTICLPSPINNGSDDYIIDPCLCIEEEIDASYNFRVGEILLPIGVACDGYFTLCITQTGRIFKLAEGEIYKLGDSWYKALENIHTHKGIEIVASLEEVAEQKGYKVVKK